MREGGMKKQLSEEQIAEARALASTLTQSEIARQLGVKQYTISRAIGQKGRNLVDNLKADDLKIEKGIAIPMRATERIYPFNIMEIGDSFLIPPSSSKRSQNALSAAKAAGMKATSRKQPDGSVRVWRIA
jgi:hypothetical protein